MLGIELWLIWRHQSSWSSGAPWPSCTPSCFSLARHISWACVRAPYLCPHFLRTSNNSSVCFVIGGIFSFLLLRYVIQSAKLTTKETNKQNTKSIHPNQPNVPWSQRSFWEAPRADWNCRSVWRPIWNRPGRAVWFLEWPAGTSMVVVAAYYCTYC